MTTNSSSFEPSWDRYPMISAQLHAKRWIQGCVMLGLAKNTIAAYAYAIEGFLGFCQSQSINVLSISPGSIAQYVGALRTQPRRGNANVVRIDSDGRLSNATLQQRLTAVRLFFDFLVDDELIKINPVTRRRYTLSKQFGGGGERGPIQHFHQLPWIPSEEQWASLLAVASKESIRNRCMLAFAYV